MAGKGKKKGEKKGEAKSKDDGGEEKKKGKKGGGGKGKKGKGKSRCNVDMMTEAAMDNCYYVCHNVQDLLQGRGFAWPEAQKKKKKGKR